MEEWGGDMSLWVSNFGGVSDKEREMERWRPAVAREKMRKKMTFFFFFFLKQFS